MNILGFQNHLENASGNKYNGEVYVSHKDDGAVECNIGDVLYGGIELFMRALDEGIVINKLYYNGLDITDQKEEFIDHAKASRY